MSDPLDLFGMESDVPAENSPVNPMSPDQRSQIRSLFAALNVTGAREQFDLVHLLAGKRISSVQDLDAKSAAILIPRLRKRVDSQSKTVTGNLWDDREEDTWIDNL